MVIKLKRSYPSIHGLPVIHSIDTDLFELKYFMKCMDCSYCNDQCCSYGCDIDMENVNRILAHADELEKYVGLSRQRWFNHNKKGWDHEYPGHEYTRTRKFKGKCVFLNQKGRGCMLHSFALNKKMDYHELKPFFCSFFPFTYMEGVLCTPEEIDDKTLGCIDDGPSLYEGARDEVRYYFGDEIVEELDEIYNNYIALHPVKKVKTDKLVNVQLPAERA